MTDPSDDREGSPLPDSPLAALWSASSIAIIGATERMGAMGRLPIDYLLKYGYGGRILPVNPKGGTVMGLRVYRGVAEAAQSLDGPIELALIMVPAGAVQQAVADCADAGGRVWVAMSGGDGGVEDDGDRRQDGRVRGAQQ